MKTLPQLYFGEEPDEERIPDEDAPPTLFGEELEPGRTIVLVPGILGSEILHFTPQGENRADRYEKIRPPVSDNSNNVGSIEDLIDTRSDTGLSSAPKRKPRFIRSEFGYEPLISNLENDGFTERNGKLLLFGYDWTKSNNLNGRILADVIRVLAGPNQEYDVDVIAHSMGGLVTRSAILLHGPTPIRKTVYLASPHYGAPKAYWVLHPRAPFHLADSWWKQLLIEKVWQQYAEAYDQPQGQPLSETLKILAQQMPSAYELLPDEFYFDQSHVVEGQYFTGMYPVDSLDETYYTEVPYELGVQGRPMARQAMQFKSALGEDLPGDHLSLYNNRVKTEDLIAYDHFDESPFFIPGVDNPVTTGWEVPWDSGGHGDGTVPTRSANRGNSFLVTGSHTQIPNTYLTYTHIRNYLELYDN